MTPQLAAEWAAAIGPDVEPAPFEDPAVDEEQTELARIDALWHRKFGPVTCWEPRVRRAYLTTVDAIHESFHPKAA